MATTTPTTPKPTTPDPAMLNQWYTDYLKSNPQTQNAQAAQWTPTEDATVQGQFNKITAEGSPLMDMATTQSQQNSAARGLLNSSIAIGEGQKAAYSAALPIAQQDASTYATAQSQNAAAKNAASTFNAGQYNTALGQRDQAGAQGFLALQNIQADKEKQQAQFKQEASMQEAANKFTTTRDAALFQQDLQRINAQTDAAIKLYDAQNGTKLYEDYRANSQQTYDAYISAVQQIQTSDMDENVKAAQIKNLQQMFVTRQDFLNTMYAEMPQWAEEWSTFDLSFGTTGKKGG